MKTCYWNGARFATALLVAWTLGQEAKAQPLGPITVTREGSQLTLSWDSAAGKPYRLQSSVDLSGPWQRVGTQPEPLVASGSRLSCAVSSTEGMQFYRVLELSGFGPDRMVWISPGTFTMGSPTEEEERRDDEGPQTVVTITRGFWMGKYEATQGDWMIGPDPSFFNGIKNRPEPVDFTDPNRPVEQVTFATAVFYCGRITEMTRDSGWIAPNWAYRLPTEAEWEYACRAGTTTRFSHGDDPGYGDLASYAWYGESTGAGSTHSRGQKLPNPWGLYDMGGNVAEWCQDWYGPYPGGEVTDPRGPLTGTAHVLRGGNWCSPPSSCRSGSRRSWGIPSWYDSGTGFRLVLAPE